jgi:putative transposase
VVLRLLNKQVRKRKKPVGSSWRMDETYIKLNGRWIYLYRAVDSLGNTIEFLLRRYRDKAAAKHSSVKLLKTTIILIK